jgi:hypothetical protein
MLFYDYADLSNPPSERLEEVSMVGFGRQFILLLAVTQPFLVVSPAFAEPSYTNVAQAGVPDIGTLEKRYFGHAYDKDATDKRIQRLELLLFGATQDGGMVERLDRLQDSAADHAKAPKTGAGQTADTASIAALERKILKKSFAAETPAQRLGRLESKVFGQPSPSMSIADRVFRLKKILNVETPSISRLPSMPNSANSDLASPSPFGSYSYVPFGPGASADDLSQQMNEMIKQLNKSMRGLHRLPDGAPNVSPFAGPNGSPFAGPNGSPFAGPNGSPFSGPNGSPFTGPNGSPFAGPNGSPFSGPGSPFAQPFHQPRHSTQQPKGDTELPPYLDPNSI